MEDLSLHLTFQINKYTFKKQSQNKGLWERTLVCLWKFPDGMVYDLSIIHSCSERTLEHMGHNWKDLAKKVAGEKKEIGTEPFFALLLSSALLVLKTFPSFVFIRIFKNFLIPSSIL